ASALQAECQQFDPVSAHHKRRRYMRNAVSSFLYVFFGGRSGLTERDCRATPGAPCREGFELKAGIFLFISNNIY
ncbi:hypothetical protein, partial [Acidaminococcus massiliensis]|uniref:hypothetical protein n=1 Tax=Acidaminococcus massiliensis TaxID=1852375 RepID=UPI0026DA9B92